MPIYMKFTSPDVKGNVTTEGFKDQIEVTSLTWGTGRAVSTTLGKGGNRESSTPSVSEVTVTKELDNASGGLLKEAFSSHSKAGVTLSFVRTDESGAKTYLTATLTDVAVTSFNLSSGGDRPHESLSFNFIKIEWKFIPVLADGTDGSAYPVTYDLTAQKLT